MKAWYVDSSGNLLPKFAQFVIGTYHGPSVNPDLAARSVEGKRGTFYFDTPLGVRRGILNIGSDQYDVGLFDYDNDGLFNGKVVH